LGRLQNLAVTFMVTIWGLADEKSFFCVWILEPCAVYLC
jgi:hypothetical protein